MSNGALMNALHAWPGWQVTRAPNLGVYQAWVWWPDVPAFRFEERTMAELARAIDECRLENPRPSIHHEVPA